jgi:hypothetical protein
MTVVSFVVITLGLAGVFVVFWCIVELTGGAAGQALSVCRSMQAGFATWRETRDDERIDSAAAADSDANAARDRGPDGFEVPIEPVDRGPARRRQG